MKRVFVILSLVLVVAALSMADTTTIDLPARIAQLESAVFGGTNVAGTATPLFVKLAGSGAQTVTGGALVNTSGFTGPLVGTQQDIVAQLIASDGAVTAKAGVVMITKGTALAGTLAAPVAVTDDGKILRIYSTTAAAHVITSGTDGFNAKGSSGTCTLAAAIGNGVTLVAYNGHWYVVGSVGNTVA